MGTYVIKPCPDEDLYVVWCDGADGRGHIGDRVETLHYLDSVDPGVRYTSDERIDWADQHGTSARWPKPGDPGFEHHTGGFIYGWDDPGFVVKIGRYGQRWLPRVNLKEFTQALDANRLEEAYRLTEACDS